MTAWVTTIFDKLVPYLWWNQTASQTKDCDIEILQAFVEVYCFHHHEINHKGDLCPECSDLLRYAAARRKNCPYDPKPACKNCQTHCYAKHRRQKIKEVMKFSGMYYVKRGRIDWLIKYFLM